MNQANEEEMFARFSKNVWWFRAQRKLSQEGLAFHAEIHRTQVSLIESQKRSVQLPTLIRLAGALEVPVESLVEGITYRPPETGRSGRYSVEPLELPINRIRIR